MEKVINGKVESLNEDTAEQQPARSALPYIRRYTHTQKKKPKSSKQEDKKG